MSIFSEYLQDASEERRDRSQGQEHEPIKLHHQHEHQLGVGCGAETLQGEARQEAARLGGGGKGQVGEAHCGANLKGKTSKTVTHSIGQ